MRERDSINDGTLLLCEAWESSKDEKTEHTLIAALRSCFEPLGVRSVDDTKFVAGVRDWYMRNKDAYAPNVDYESHPNHTTSKYEPIFVKRN